MIREGCFRDRFLAVSSCRYDPCKGFHKRRRDLREREKDREEEEQEAGSQ